MTPTAAVSASKVKSRISGRVSALAILSPY
jgi:hypothetical protein